MGRLSKGVSRGPKRRTWGSEAQEGRSDLAAGTFFFLLFLFVFRLCWGPKKPYGQRKNVGRPLGPKRAVLTRQLAGVFFGLCSFSCFFLWP